MRFTGLLAGVVVTLIGLAVARQSSSKAEETATKVPADLAWVPTGSAAVVSFRPADLWVSETGKAMRAKLANEKEVVAHLHALLGVSLFDIDRVTIVVPDVKSKGKPFVVFVTTTKAQDAKKLVARLMPEATEKKHKEKVYHAHGKGSAVALLSDRIHVLGTEANIKQILERGNAPQDGVLTPSLTLADKHVLVVGVNCKMLAESTAPPFAKATEALSKAKSASLTADVGKGVELRLNVRFANEKEATAGEKSVNFLRHRLLGMLTDALKDMEKDKAQAGNVKLLRQIDQSLSAMKLVIGKDTVSARVSLNVDAPMLTGMILELGTKARATSARALSVNHLKQIGLALHIYHDKNNAFPPAAMYDKKGKALLSWRVLILPYLDEKKLYDEFKLDEAWDSPHNKKLLARMPKVFISPSGKEKANHTFYQAFVGKGAAFEGKTGLTVGAFTDGLSNTLLVAEASVGVPWTKPADLDYTPGKKLPAVGGTASVEGFLGLLGDGAVRFFPKTMKAKTLEAFITRKNGDSITPDD